VSSQSILAEVQRAKDEYDAAQITLTTADRKLANARRRLDLSRKAVGQIIDATAARTGIHRLNIAVCDGEHVAVMTHDGEVYCYRASMIGPVPAPANPARDAADAAGIATYECGCTPKEAGVPCDGNGNGEILDIDFEFSPDDVVGLGPLAEPLIAHPLANGHARPAVADAVADLAPDDEGFVPASALGAMRSAAASQAWGASSNAIG
jgi:hypothetical protein